MPREKITEQQERPVCKMCRINKCMPSRKNSLGFQLWYSICASCADIKYNKVTRNDKRA